MTAVPMRRPVFAASARRESGAAAMPEPVTALAAVVMPSAAATPAAPTARRRRILMYCLLCATKSPSLHSKVSGTIIGMGKVKGPRNLMSTVPHTRQG